MFGNKTSNKLKTILTANFLKTHFSYRFAKMGKSLTY